MHKIKVEILLPKFYNDKRRVELDKYWLTLKEIYDQFKGYTFEKSPLLGAWKDPKTNKSYNDTNFACWVICDDTYQNMHFLKELKERLKNRFEQEDVLIYHTDVVTHD